MPAIPSTLPPSVEEAYRRKCVQLKNRTNEVEDANDAARLRLARIKRQVEKLRIERAFLLEQLAKRTSANVEDSDGSPSPPPTAPVAASFTNTAGSPTSETFSHPPESQPKPAHANGISASDSKKPTSAFELFCSETRPGLESKEKDSEIPLNIEDELARVWKGLSDGEKDEYEARFELAMAKNDESKKSPASDKKDDKPAEPKQLVQDEDIEMGDDTEDQDTQAGEKVE
ncbi:uncharacterized protein FMAN_04665 [Fusarium mangiferae]|uniref:HMG box domain-containing protein n=1 Tax=Fusarium mangiferae TaxID=192010 RepID=A0A1L7SY72_FUSMA|nr:uncharacterized protein FMAN_04665 [Fusarium mangiferae]CVK88853.1 uncharacterized protein FMAN_04665 [Fusarium mangiferae]